MSICTLNVCVFILSPCSKFYAYELLLQKVGEHVNTCRNTVKRKREEAAFLKNRSQFFFSFFPINFLVSRVFSLLLRRRPFICFVFTYIYILMHIQKSCHCGLHANNIKVDMHKDDGTLSSAR